MRWAEQFGVWRRWKRWRRGRRALQGSDGQVQRYLRYRSYDMARAVVQIAVHYWGSGTMRLKRTGPFCGRVRRERLRCAPTAVLPRAGVERATREAAVRSGRPAALTAGAVSCAECAFLAPSAVVWRLGRHVQTDLSYGGVWVALCRRGGRRCHLAPACLTIRSVVKLLPRRARRCVCDRKTFCYVPLPRPPAALHTHVRRLRYK